MVQINNIENSAIVHLLKPEDCKDMIDIRLGIDTIDQEIIALIGRSYQYVKSAAKFKTTESAVKSPERFAAMLLQRREWAESQHLNPDVIEKIYADLVNYFIGEELNLWKKKDH